MEREVTKMSVNDLNWLRNNYNSNYNGSIDGAIGAGFGAAVILAVGTVFALLAANVAQSTPGVVGCSIVSGICGLISLAPIMGGCWPYAVEAHRYAKRVDECDEEIQRRAKGEKSI